MTYVVRALLLASTLFPLAVSCSQTPAAKPESDLALKFRCAELGRHDQEREEAQIEAQAKRDNSLAALGVVRFGYSPKLNTCVYSEKGYSGVSSFGFIQDMLTGDDIWSYAVDISKPGAEAVTSEAHLDQIGDRLLGVRKKIDAPVPAKSEGLK